MPVAFHKAPIYPGEDIFSHPTSDDPRLAPWFKRLEELGVIDEKGKIKKKGTVLRRGIGPDGYIWEIEWED